MKEIIKKILIIALICFSFFYTDKVINLINNKSKLMEEIRNNMYNYNVIEVDAQIKDDTIIPGTSGKVVNVEDSFNNMKEYNTFMDNLLIYDSILPENMLKDNRDKYIIKGSSNKKEVSILLIVSDSSINKINSIKNMTLFVNHNLITINNINKLKDNELYSYGNNGNYTKNILDNDSLLIDRLSNNNHKYCLAKKKDDNVLEVCSNNNFNTVLPNIIGGYIDVKNNLSNGSIILVNNINEIDSIVTYINSKGYNMVPLSVLLLE